MKKPRGLLAAILLLFAVSFVSPMAAAAPTAYEFTVTGLSGPLAGVTSVGTFTFNPLIVPDGGGYVFVAGVFTHLSFSWEGIDYDETTANTGDLGFEPDGTLFHALFGTDCGPSGFGCGIGNHPTDWSIGWDDGSGVFYYRSITDPINIFDGVVSLTPLSVPATKQQCKNDGWKAFEGPDGPFKDQGDCIQFVNTGK